jgi:hypothetical protein
VLIVSLFVRFLRYGFGFHLIVAFTWNVLINKYFWFDLIFFGFRGWRDWLNFGSIFFPLARKLPHIHLRDSHYLWNVLNFRHFIGYYFNLIFQAFTFGNNLCYYRGFIIAVDIESIVIVSTVVKLLREKVIHVFFLLFFVFLQFGILKFFDFFAILGFNQVNGLNPKGRVSKWGDLVLGVHGMGDQGFNVVFPLASARGSFSFGLIQDIQDALRQCIWLSRSILILVP